MRKLLSVLLATPLFVACGGDHQGNDVPKADTVAVADTFQWESEQFADVRVLRYQVPGWDQLTLQQKQLCYYLNMAGLAGRDIMWDQNYRHNLKVRRALESVQRKYTGERVGAQWAALRSTPRRCSSAMVSITTMGWTSSSPNAAGAISIR